MAATIDVYTTRPQLPAGATHGTLAMIQTGARTAELWVFRRRHGWLRAAHGAATQPGG